MDETGGGRISISLDTLRNELAQLELRLVDRIQASLDAKADKAVVSQHDARITSLEMSRAGREHLAHDVERIEKRTTALEATDQARSGERDFKRYIFPAAITLVSAGWWIPALIGH